MTEVIELMAQVFLLHPTLGTSPMVRVGRVLRTGGVEIAVGLLSRRNDVNHGIDVCLERLVGIGLENVRRALDGLVGVGIVEGIANAVHLEGLRRVGEMGSRILEVLVAPLALAFRESERDGHLPAGLQSLSPEGARRDFHGGERYGGDGITLLRPDGAK